jgi:uncharacterized membrane protein
MVNLRKELYRIIVSILLLGFFLIPGFGYAIGMDPTIYATLAFICFFAGVFLALYGLDRGLAPDDVNKRMKVIDEAITPLFLIPIAYGLCLVLSVLGIWAYLSVGAIEPMIGMLAVALIVFVITILTHIHYRNKKKRTY